MKFTIRFTISSIFVTLLTIVCLAIIAINYFSLDDVFVKSSSLLLNRSADFAVIKVKNYLQPLETRSNVSEELFGLNFINTADLKNLQKYLLGLVLGKNNISAAYFADPAGNFYMVNEDFHSEKIYAVRIYRSVDRPYKVTEEVDSLGKVLSSKKTYVVKYDPRIRPWYKESLESEHHAWSDIYKFQFAAKDQDVFGLTSANRITTPKNKFLGVFAIDTTFDFIAKFISKLEITKNTYIFFIDENNNLIASKGKCANKLCSINELDIPWAKQAYALYKENKQPLFFFKFNGKKYFAAYKDLFKGEYHIIVILPEDDIIGPLEHSVKISLLAAFLILLCSFLVTSIAAGKMSKPIIQLADDAKRVEQLNLKKQKSFRSRITEIVIMRKAFDSMKSALKSFIRYVPFALVKNLIKSGDIARVGGKIKEITILFIDIQSFTALSEPMRSENLMEYLSEYLEKMSHTIQIHKGTIDKYIGDAIMAFWGAPRDDSKHALHACEGALGLIETLDELNKAWRSRGLPELSVRIGINTANVVVGNVGSQDRLSYTAIGDGVNLANRLEGLNKIYKTRILVSQSTYRAVGEALTFRLLDYVTVRGKKHECYVYELLSTVNQDINEYNKTFQSAFALYSKGQWDAAIEIFEKMQPLYSNDKLLSIYIDRCKQFKKYPPKDWKGIWMLHD